MAFPANIDLSSLNGTSGFKLSGQQGSHSGFSVASAGDVNGDGFDDVIVGASYASPNGAISGSSYVVFGKAAGFGANINLTALNGATGFKLNGAAAFDYAAAVASAGDVNGDGFADLIVGARGVDANGSNSGASYVVFGKASGFATTVELSGLNGTTGFRLVGVAATDASGWSVASAGDMNGDGFDDVIVGARYAADAVGRPGASYVVFGKSEGFAASIDLSSLNGPNGFKVNGAAANDSTGRSVASAGDVNGDGYDDLIVGASNADPHGESSGAAYIVFGRATAFFPASFDLAALAGSGYRLNGAAAGDMAGASVASAGDVNGDGFADVIIGAKYADANGSNSGASYVVFGRAGGFGSSLELSSLNGVTGFRLTGASAGEQSGYSVRSAGDMNGDGFSDLIVGARFASPNGTYSGASYVVFGKASGFAANIDLSSLDGSTGFKLSGAVAFDMSGFSVASAGDVNGDGFDDLIIGARLADAPGTSSGASYVVFGGAFGASTTPVTTTGTAAAEVLIGGVGDDVLTGGGAADVFHAGAGNDRLIVADLTFRLADGGGGVDTLALAGGGRTLDLGNPVAAAKLDGIERIDLSGNGNNALAIGQIAILGGIGAVSGAKHVLTVEGNAGDAVQLDGGAWVQTDTFTDASGTFDRWVLGNAEILIEQGVAVSGFAVLGVTIEGTAGHDTISTTKTVAGQPVATAYDDTINGHGGNDRLDGGAGADVMTGGAGNDTYHVDDANDEVIEAIGGGNDTVYAGSDFTLAAGQEIEYLRVLAGTVDARTLTGNEFANSLFGGPGADWLYGGDGDDRLDGGAGFDRMFGGAGNDIYYVDSTGDQVVEVSGKDTIYTTANFTLALGLAVETVRVSGTSGLTLVGNELANALYGGVGADRLEGEGGNDWLDGGAGADVMFGGSGDDIFLIDDANDRAFDTVGTDTIYSTVSYTIAAGEAIENLRAQGSIGLVLTGNEFANALYGTIGIDTLNGGQGDDRLDGGANADTMAGGDGDDAYVADQSGDVVTEFAGQGTDTINAWVGWTLGANLEQLRLMGAADLDGTGNGLNNALFGNAGENVLNGGAGADTMTGGRGDDTYIVDQSDDVVVERASGGTDLVRSSAASYRLGGNVENLVLIGDGSIDGTGNRGMNVLTGNAGNNLLDGGAGADAMAGGEGDDTYVVDDAGDVVTELANGGTDLVRSSVSHVLSANVENLTLLGRASLGGTGNDLANVLTGSGGRNVLDGGLGADVLVGGGGGDTFRFSTALGPDNVDRIVLFNHKNDTIQLDDAVFAVLGTGALATGAFNLGVAASQADDRILFDTASKSLYYDADGLGGADAVRFATIDTLQGVLDHTDFLIV